MASELAKETGGLGRRQDSFLVHAVDIALNAANTILGSLKTVIPGAEAIHEFKQSVEVGSEFVDYIGRET